MLKKIFWAIGIAAIVFMILYFALQTSYKNKLHVDVSGVEKTVSIKHFDDAFFTSDTLIFSSELKQLKADYPPFFSSNNSIDFWQQQRLNKSQTLLYTDWKKTMPNYTQFDSELTSAFKHLYYYYPNVPEFVAYTYISNLDFDYPIILAENYAFLAVDMYLGKTHPAYAKQNDYENFERQKDFIIRDVMSQFAQKFNTKDLNDNTLLNEMIWWGKNAYFVQAMQPEKHDTITSKMSRKELEFCLQNEVNIWTYFIDNKLIFNTNELIKRKFIAPAPFSKFGMPFDHESPGMIGRWIGWRIVSSYMENNPDITLQELMANADSKTIFKLSKYKP